MIRYTPWGPSYSNRTYCRKSRPEQTDVRTRDVRYRWYCNDVRGELDRLSDSIVIATDDGNPEPIHRTVEIAGDTADRLIARWHQGEKPRYGLLDDRDLRSGIDHHLVDDRLPRRSFTREGFDVHRMRAERDFHERALLDELAERNDRPLMNDPSHADMRWLR